MSTYLCAGQLQYGLARQLWGHIFAVLSRNGLDGAFGACELCAQIAEVNPAQILTFSALRDELHARLPLEKAESMLGSLLGGRVGVLFAPPQIDRRLVISCLYYLLQREGTLFPLAMHTLSPFPREMLCALTLQAIL